MHFGRCRAESSQTAHIVELDSGTAKAELRGHDNVVEAAVFIPVTCIPAIRELLGQKVPPFYTLVDYLIKSLYSQQHRAVYLTMRASRMLRHPQGIKR